MIKNKGMRFCFAVDQLGRELFAQILTQLPEFIT